MSRVKFIMLSMLAAFALSAVASATASAHEFFINGSALSKTEEVQGNSIPYATENKFESIIAKLNVNINCAVAVAPGGAANVLETAGKIKSKIEFKDCSIYKTAKGATEEQIACSLKEPVVAEAEGSLNGAGELELKPTAANKTLFSEFEIVGTGCAIAGKQKVEGEPQRCAIPNYGVEAEIGFVSCGPGGSALKLGTEGAKLYFTIALVSKVDNKFYSN